MANEMAKRDDGDDIQPAQMIPAGEAGIAGAMVRARAEIESAIIVAKKYPRDETSAWARLMKAVSRPSLAADAVYILPRGNENIEGPSVNLAREAARIWGNTQYGLRIVTEDDERVHLEGEFWDVENNTKVVVQDRFAKLIYRKRGGWIRPDESQLRELVNRRGAFAVRNAILQGMPRDIIDAAVDAAKETMKKAAAGDLTKNREDAVRYVVKCFDRFAVTAEMIAAKLGHPAAQVSDEELAMLRQVWKSMADGASKREDHFEFASKRAEGTADILAGATPGVATHAAPGTTVAAPTVAPVPPAPEQAPLDPALAAFRGTFIETLCTPKLGRTPEKAAAIWGELAAAHPDADDLGRAASAFLDTAEAQAAEAEKAAPKAPPVVKMPDRDYSAQAKAAPNLLGKAKPAPQTPAQKATAERLAREAADAAAAGSSDPMPPNPA